MVDLLLSVLQRFVNNFREGLDAWRTTSINELGVGIVLAVNEEGRRTFLLSGCLEGCDVGVNLVVHFAARKVFLELRVVQLKCCCVCLEIWNGVFARRPLLPVLGVIKRVMHFPVLALFVGCLSGTSTSESVRVDLEQRQVTELELHSVVVLLLHLLDDEVVALANGAFKVAVFLQGDFRAQVTFEMLGRLTAGLVAAVRFVAVKDQNATENQHDDSDNRPKTLIHGSVVTP
jgi:hypothetical protein